MVNKTPIQITSGTANDDSVVHASDAAVSDLSRSHKERDISRLQGTAPLFSASKTYAVNDLVTESGIVYRNIVAIVVPAAFDGADWVRISPIDISCKATKTTDQAIPRITTTTITWNSELYDTDSMHDNSTNNSRITIKTAGKYSILAQAEWGINSGGFRFLDMIKNGTDGIARVRYQADNASENIISYVGEFAVNDYIELNVFQDTGGDLDFESGTGVENTYLEAHKIN